MNIKDNHDFILYNNIDLSIWLDKNLQQINIKMGFLELYEDEESYSKAKMKA